MCAPIRGQRGKPLGFPLKSQKFAAVSSARISRAEYLLAQAKPRFCVSAPLFANTFAFAGKVNAARVKWCALKRRAAEENSDCTEQSEANGVFLKITKICFNSLKQIL